MKLQPICLVLGVALAGVNHLAAAAVMELVNPTPQQRLETVQFSETVFSQGSATTAFMQEVLNSLDRVNNPQLALPRASAEGSFLRLNPEVQRNVRTVVERFDLFSIGGTPVKDDNYREAVSVGGFYTWCCSGVLIASNAVLTASHCTSSCGKRICLGTNANTSKEIYFVREAKVHTNYNAVTFENDITILILASNVPLARFPTLASKSELDVAAALRLVSFGHTNRHGTIGSGIKRFVDVPIVARSCLEAVHVTNFNCHLGAEIVASAPLLQRDQCSGDSGGASYVIESGRTNLAALASRSLKSTNRCGNGGIYVRVHPYEPWIRDILRIYPP